MAPVFWFVGKHRINRDHIVHAEIDEIGIKLVMTIGSTLSFTGSDKTWLESKLRDCGECPGSESGSYSFPE